MEDEWREETRKDFKEFFEKFFDEKVNVEFSDECSICLTKTLLEDKDGKIVRSYQCDCGNLEDS